MINRRRFGALGFFALIVPSITKATEPPSSSKARLIIHTFLEAKPGLRSDLGEFIRLNWLAMDRQGIDQGIFTHAVLLESISSDLKEAGRPVDYTMEVGYYTAGGYPEISKQFLEIRKRHQTILVNGRGLGELGDILGERQLRPLASA